jgi:hypothetical protein
MDMKNAFKRNRSTTAIQKKDVYPLPKALKFIKNPAPLFTRASVPLPPATR